MLEKKTIVLLDKWKQEIEDFSFKSKTVYIALFSVNGNLLYCNPAFKSILINESVESLINPTFQKLLDIKVESSLIFEGFLTIGSLIKNQSIQSSIYRKNDEILIIGEVEIEQIMQLNSAMIELNREINNLQRQLIKEKQNLDKTNIKLKQINEEKDRFLGIAAHDLRNPIGTALGYADMLNQRFSRISPQDIQKFLLVIVDSCQFSLNLLNDLLDISKIESGKVQLSIRETDYIRLISNIVERNQLFAKQKDIEIKFTSKVKTLPVHIDSQKIEQVLNNLITNAIKYSNPKTLVKVNITTSKNSFKTEVIDQGQGIPTEEIPKLFAPFQTTSVRSTAGEKSTGLGLAIVKKIITEHGGEIKVESKPGKGSKFYFALPIRK